MNFQLKAHDLDLDDVVSALLRAAASLVDGQSVDLGDVAASLDRGSLTLLLAAIAHAGGSHDQREETTDLDSRITLLGDKAPRSWPGAPHLARLERVPCPPRPQLRRLPEFAGTRDSAHPLLQARLQAFVVGQYAEGRSCGRSPS